MDNDVAFQSGTHGLLAQKIHSTATGAFQDQLLHPAIYKISYDRNEKLGALAFKNATEKCDSVPVVPLVPGIGISVRAVAGGYYLPAQARSVDAAVCHLAFDHFFGKSPYAVGAMRSRGIDEKIKPVGERIGISTRRIVNGYVNHLFNGTNGA